MLASLLLATQLAQASDIGKTKTFGIGVAIGYPMSVTGKFWLDDKGGIAVFAGTGFTYFNFRGQYERDFIEFHDWDWAQFGMYWDIGAELNVYPTSFLYRTGGIGPGVYGGVGAWLRFHNVPAEVFVEVDAGAQYVTYSSIVPIAPLYHTIAGGRWYF